MITYIKQRLMKEKYDNIIYNEHEVHIKVHKYIIIKHKIEFKKLLVKAN